MNDRQTRRLVRDLFKQNPLSWRILPTLLILEVIQVELLSGVGKCSRPADGVVKQSTQGKKLRKKLASVPS